MASTAALTAAAQDRKSRLAQLKSLKRKQEVLQDDHDIDERTAADVASSTADISKVGTNKYISGRNYDFETKGAKLGFEATPTDGQITLEKKAAELEDEVAQQAGEEEQEDKPLDLFKLQPKKPNWDLKRDLELKLEILNVRTDNAIAKLVRERISKQQAAARAKLNGSGNGDGDIEAAGIEGTTLVEATKEREREDEEAARRERAEEDALLEVP